MADRANYRRRRRFSDDEDDDEEDVHHYRGRQYYSSDDEEVLKPHQKPRRRPSPKARQQFDRQPPPMRRTEEDQRSDNEPGEKSPRGNYQHRDRVKDEEEYHEQPRTPREFREKEGPGPRRRTDYPERPDRRRDNLSPGKYSPPRRNPNQGRRRYDEPERNRHWQRAQDEYGRRSQTPEDRMDSPPQRPNRRNNGRMPNQQRNRNYPDDDDDDEDDHFIPGRQQLQPNRGRQRRGHFVPPNRHQDHKTYPGHSSEEEDSDDSVYGKNNRQRRGNWQGFQRENEITPEFLIRILEKKRDMRVTLLHLLENYHMKTSSVRQLVTAHPNLFRIVGETGETVQLDLKVKICSAHNGHKGCFSRSTCKDLHICSDYINRKCNVEDCVMGHSWTTRHNNKLLENFSIHKVSQLSLQKMFRSSLSISNTNHNPPSVCFRYNQGKCKNRNCHYLHVCFSFIVGRSKCIKHPCKLNHDLLAPECCRVLEAADIDVNESPRDVLVALLEANPSLKDKASKEVNNPPKESQDRPTPHNDDISDTSKAKEENKSNPASADGKKKDIRKKKNRTVWSHHARGDVDFTEICYDSVESVCANEGTGCQRLHALDHYHWQVSQEGTTWLNLQDRQVIALEQFFCDVNNDQVKIPRVDPSHGSSSSLLVLLGRDSWEADFDTMKITDSKKSKSFQTRRLCTEMLPGKRVKPSSFVWHFQDKQQNWVEYGKVDSLGETNLVSSLTSDAIEQQYIKDSSKPITFQNSKFTYTLDFQSMTQTNQHTQVARNVRRRPQAHLKMEEEEEQAKQRKLPSNWDQMQPNERTKRVAVQSNSEEYTKIVQLLGNQISANNVVKLERVQNRFHWNAFQNKIEEMSSIYGDITKVGIRQLFHGTGHNIVANICAENFDPRLHGQAAGQAYGQGAYFARDANLSYGYCKADTAGQKYMFVAEVAVGSLTLGNSSMARPPINPTTQMPFDATGDNNTNPSIIVKYDKAEYYPKYILTLK